MTLSGAVLTALLAVGGWGQSPVQDLATLPSLSDERTLTVNALWGENPKSRQFGQGRNRVVVADLKGPGVITMMHFALPQAMKLDRALLLRIYWDGERNPSVEAPLVDFFCDPNGRLERVDSLLVNKKRGWNCYFPMPFRRSARVELEWDGPGQGAGSWSESPCYSYVTYRRVKALPPDTGYFHALWNQKSLLLGSEEYRVFEAVGKGHFIGWNMTIHPVAPNPGGYPVDENVKFFVDGETTASTEWQGLEDGFGFSWGFPEEANSFPYTGWQPYGEGAAAYRFCVSDRIGFRRSLRMTVGFGSNETPFFRETFSKPEYPLQLSSVAYWYQSEPHKPFPRMAAYRDRLQAPSARQLAERRAREQRYRDAGETLVLRCGHPEVEEEFLEEGWSYRLSRGARYFDTTGQVWKGPIRHCWSGDSRLQFDLTCPPGSSGTLRLHLVDGDRFMGGRRQRVICEGRILGDVSDFVDGRWMEAAIGPADTADGRITVQILNLRPDANAVVSEVRFAGAR